VQRLLAHATLSGPRAQKKGLRRGLSVLVSCNLHSLRRNRKGGCRSSTQRVKATFGEQHRTRPSRSGGGRSAFFAALLGSLRKREIMEKVIACTKCRKMFKASGPFSVVKEIPRGVTCPFCAGYNEVMWPMDTSITTIPKKQTENKLSGLALVQ
jgi:hypothetical protein